MHQQCTTPRLPAAGASTTALTPFFAPGYCAINPIEGPAFLFLKLLHECGLFDDRCDSGPDPDTKHPCLAMRHDATAEACVVTSYDHPACMTTTDPELKH